MPRAGGSKPDLSGRAQIIEPGLGTLELLQSVGECSPLLRNILSRGGRRSFLGSPCDGGGLASLQVGTSSLFAL
jgi:hypothetical protein